MTAKLCTFTNADRNNWKIPYQISDNFMYDAYIWFELLLQLCPTKAYEGQRSHSTTVLLFLNKTVRSLGILGGS